MEKYDVLIVGGGVAGLFLAETLTELGARIALVEEGSTLAGGPSTRNGAYIHAGGFHAASIESEERALRSAAGCREGAERIKSRFPEAVIREGLPVHLLIRSPERVDQALKRWEMADINVKPTNSSDLKRRYPGLDASKVSFAARVLDFAVNSRIMFQKLYAKSKKMGAEFYLGSIVDKVDGNKVTIKRGDELKTVYAEKIIYCTGYKSPDLIAANKDRWNNPPRIELWKSHVVLTPPIPGVGFMYVDPGQVSVTPQGRYAVVCQCKEETLVPKAGFDPIESKVSGIKDALIDVMPNIGSIRNQLSSNTCIKVSLIPTDKLERNVDYSVTRVSENEWIALPGKSSAAQILADKVLSEIIDDTTTPVVAKRPGDVYAASKSKVDANPQMQPK